MQTQFGFTKYTLSEFRTWLGSITLARTSFRPGAPYVAAQLRELQRIKPLRHAAEHEAVSREHQWLERHRPALLDLS